MATQFDPLKKALPVCVGCKREIREGAYRDVIGEMWHELCWQREVDEMACAPIDAAIVRKICRALAGEQEKMP